MAVASISFGAVGGGVQAMRLADAVTEIKTLSASNQQTTAVATTDRPVVRIATESAVYVSVGTNPDATSDAGRIYIPAGAVEYLGVSPGFEVAIVTA